MSVRPLHACEAARRCGSRALGQYLDRYAQVKIYVEREDPGRRTIENTTQVAAYPEGMLEEGSRR